ncbi:MAG TPA: hypothetical protein VLA83_05190 [Candidatus Binatia bacterium]|nr:hypothetical protein [Candidatus Binatia bacterium]
MPQPDERKVQEVRSTADALSAAGATQWGLATRLAFRLVFAYEIIYSFPFPLDLLPWSDKIFAWHETLLSKMTVWTGAHILHLSKPLVYSFYDSGDSMFGWVRNLVQLMLAVAAAAIWTLLDRKRSSYRSLQEWLWLYVRLVLGAAMIGYGAIKVIKVQFPDLFLWRLLSPYGDSSPTGLLWSFMGYSRAYNIFTGLVELLGGALLFVPRLATLGALVCIGSMANVFMLNVSYDVSVKLYSFNLLLMGVYLMAPEARRMLNVFVLNRVAAPVAHSPLFRKKWLNAGVLVLQLVLLIYLGGHDLYQSHKRYTQSGDGAPPPPLYGVYTVDEFIVDGQARPAVFTDEARWQRVTFERFNLVAIFAGDGPVRRYKIKLDQSKKGLELNSIRGGNWKADFSFEQRSPTLLTLHGEMDGKKIQANLRKLELKSMPLYEGGIHWITDASLFR